MQFPEATVLATDFKTTAINAALINGMFAHSDETDDVDPLTKAHPGSGVVPAAFAMAEREQRFVGMIDEAVDVFDKFKHRDWLAWGRKIMPELAEVVAEEEAEERAAERARQVAAAEAKLRAEQERFTELGWRTRRRYTTPA